MKKIKQSLHSLNLGDKILNRNELKQITGGWVYCADFHTWCPDGYQCDATDGSCTLGNGGTGGSPCPISCHNGGRGGCDSDKGCRCTLSTDSCDPQ